MPDLSLNRRVPNQTGLQERAVATQVTTGAGLAGGKQLGLCVAGQRGIDDAAAHGVTGESWVAAGQAAWSLTGSGVWALFFGQWSLSMGMPWLSFFHFIRKFLCQ